MPDAHTPNQDRPPLWTDRHGWWRAIVALLAALLVYGGSALVTGRTSTAHSSYFEHLAAAFLEGHLYLPDPPGESDLTLYEGRWYVPFPPLGAILMLPWVAVFGAAGTNTVLFSILWGAISVALVERILTALARRGWIELGAGDRCWLLVLFALGCVHWQVATEGSVWFLSHTCTVMFVALSVWLAIETRSPLLAGVGLALAIWGRPNVVFTLPLLVGIFAQKMFDADGVVRRTRLLMRSSWLILPVGVSVAGLMAYNHARFEDPFDFGYAKQKVSAEVRGDLARGQFHPYHIPRNLHVLLMGVPRWNAEKSVLAPDARGMSVLLTTPALLCLVGAWRRREAFVRGAWIAVGLLLVPLLLYYNTGWRQFGYRFSLDFMVPLMVLLGVAAGQRVSWPMRGLILLGVLVNAWGVVWWCTDWLG